MMVGAGDRCATFWEESKSLGLQSGGGWGQTYWGLKFMKAEVMIKAEMLFTKYHNTGTKGHSITLVVGEFKIVRRKYSTQQNNKLLELAVIGDFLCSFVKKYFRHVLLLIPRFELAKASQRSHHLWYLMQEPNLPLTAAWCLQLLPWHYESRW